MDRRSWGSRARDRPWPPPQRAVGQEIVARDDRIDHADGPGKPPGPPAALLTATIVRIAKEDGIVEVVNKMGCAAQSTQLPPWKEFALQNYRIEFCGSGQLKRSKERCLVESFARKGPARVIEGGSKGPDTVATTNVIGRFNQGKSFIPSSMTVRGQIDGLGMPPVSSILILILIPLEISKPTDRFDDRTCVHFIAALKIDSKRTDARHHSIRNSPLYGRTTTAVRGVSQISTSAFRLSPWMH